MELKIKLLHPDAIAPAYAHGTDAGMDLYSVEDVTLYPATYHIECIIENKYIGYEIPQFEVIGSYDGWKMIKTGIAIELPYNCEAQVRPRSGMALKYAITVLNSPGTIDPGYVGEIGVVLINHGKEPFEITKGMRIAQLVIAPIVKPKLSVVKELQSTQRGSKGFGSTGV